jgi:transposase
LVENQGFPVAPIVHAPVNIHDTSLFPSAMEGFMDFADVLGLDTREAMVTLDTGFDSHANSDRILFHAMTPVIKPNRRNGKDEKIINERLDLFDEKTYTQRFCVERTFAWEDSYRKLALRYEVLEETHLGFKYLAFSMINLREYV